MEREEDGAEKWNFSNCLHGYFILSMMLTENFYSFHSFRLAHTHTHINLSVSNNFYAIYRYNLMNENFLLFSCAKRDRNAEINFILQSRKRWSFSLKMIKPSRKKIFFVFHSFNFLDILEFSGFWLLQINSKKCHENKKEKIPKYAQQWSFWSKMLHETEENTNFILFLMILPLYFAFVFEFFSLARFPSSFQFFLYFNVLPTFFYFHICYFAYVRLLMPVWVCKYIYTYCRIYSLSLIFILERSKFL
jgi:hypothetical protein